MKWYEDLFVGESVTGKIKKIKWKEVDKMRCARWTLVNIYNGGIIASLCTNCTKRKSA